MITETISITEVIWVVIGLIGLYVTARNLLTATADMKVVQKVARVLENGDYIAVAAAYVRQEAFRVVQMLTVISTGSAAMLVKPADPNQPINPIAIVIVVGVFILAAVVIIQSYLDRKLHDYLMEDKS